MQKTKPAISTTLLALILFSHNIVQSAPLLDPADRKANELISQASSPLKKPRYETNTVPGNTSNTGNNRKDHDRFKTAIIQKSQANYLTPENTLAASRSALLSKNIDWYYDTLTKEASEYEKNTFATAGTDLSFYFNMVDERNEEYILHKKPYKGGLMVIVKQKMNDINGTVLTIGAAMEKENALWKITYKYANDQELATFDKIQYTDCIANFPFTPNFLDDFCWHGNDLTNFNNTAGVLDKRNGIDLTTAKFNGVDTGLGREQLQDMPTEKLSIGGWIKALNVDHTARIIEIGNGDGDSTAIALEPGPGIKYWLYVDGARVERKIGMYHDFHDDTWHHIYLTYDGISMKFYIDGQLRDSHPASGTFDSAARLNIGLHNPTVGNRSQFFNGQIDDIQIYNKALSAEQILEKFMNGES